MTTELITPPRRATLVRIVQPVICYQHRIHWIELEGGQRFVSVRRPDIFNLNGDLVRLAADPEVGSVVQVCAVDGYLRAVQIVEFARVINPFADA